MSASNWGICPKCHQEERDRIAALAERVTNEYGKLPIAEFDALRDELAKGEQIEETFREDYEFYGAESGTVIASYSGRCQVCNLGVDFTHKEEFWPDA